MEIQNQPQLSNSENRYNYKNTFIKRWDVEFLDFYRKKEYKNIQINLSNDEIRITIDNNLFILSNKYPFYPPKVLVKNKPYLNYLQYPSSERIQDILDMNKMSCMCCSSISNRNMWSPAFQIKDILNEIKNVNKVKSYVKHYLIIDDICCSKNIDTNTIGMILLEFLVLTPTNVQRYK